MSGTLTFTGRKKTASIVKIHTSDIFIGDDEKNRYFDPLLLKNLSSEIKKNGIVSPFLVNKTEKGYTLISDADKYYAAGLAGIENIPCIIVDEENEDKGIISQIKNIYSNGFDFFKEAEAIERLISSYGMTQEDAASHLGKAQSTVANKLRLLRLTEEERKLITDNHLTERHARALLRLASPQERLYVLNMIIQYGLNVEKTELAVDKVIGQNRPKEAYRKRTRSGHSIKSYIKAIMKAVEGLESSGVNVDARKFEFDNCFELRLRIPNKGQFYNKNVSEDTYFQEKQ
ncbi:MAG: ParB/RepB/Spo0J family partition protein [Ruminococcus sp.]